ncbi:MAG: DUF1573 domain-containing protein [Thermoanaerobaculia bacterium]
MAASTSIDAAMGRRTPWSLALLAFAPAALGATPRAEVAEAVVDVGTVARGEAIEHAFEITNAGDTALELVEVKPTCGCTVAQYDRSIAPGRSGRVQAVVDTAKFRGPIAKSVRVFTNDAATPEIELVIKADVRSLIEVDPGYARFVTVLGQRQEPSRQLLWPETEGDFAVVGVRSPYPFLAASFRSAREDERRSGREGRQWVVELALQPNAPLGPLADYVVVRTDSSRLPEIQIPVSGFVRPVVAVVPAAVDFGRKDLAEPQQAILELTHLGEGSISLGGVTSSLGGVAATLEPIERGKRFRLVVTLEGGLAKGPFSGKLTIPTSSRAQPLLEIDVRGVVL